MMKVNFYSCFRLNSFKFLLVYQIPLRKFHTSMVRLCWNAAMHRLHEKGPLLPFSLQDCRLQIMQRLILFLFEEIRFDSRQLNSFQFGSNKSDSVPFNHTQIVSVGFNSIWFTFCLNISWILPCHALRMWCFRMCHTANHSSVLKLWILHVPDMSRTPIFLLESAPGLSFPPFLDSSCSSSS